MNRGVFGVSVVCLLILASITTGEAQNQQRRDFLAVLKSGQPVVIKETGCGFSAPTLMRLSEVGLTALDVSGLGGTHWGRVEGARAQPDGLQATAARTFANWGESTADSVISARENLRGVEIWASGGVRSGLDAAKLIALGAHRVGYAQPALAAATAGAEVLDRWMEQQEFELKVALFCTGSATPQALREKVKSWTIQVH